MRLEALGPGESRSERFSPLKRKSNRRFLPILFAIRSSWLQTDMRKCLGTAGVSTCKETGDIEMPLLQILMVLVVVGVLLWLVNSFIPMQGQIKSILNGVVVIAVVLWLLNIFGLFHSLSHLRIGA